MTKIKNYAVIEINLGNIEAETQKKAEDENDNMGCNIGHSSILVVSSENEKEYKFWGNLDIDTVSLMQQKIKDLEEEKERSISWSEEDFDYIAKGEEERRELGYGYYDRNRFSYAVRRMIDKHDAELGICWETIKIYLDEYCIDDKPDAWHHKWQEISVEMAKEMWETHEIFSYNIFENVDSMVNFAKDAVFNTEELAKNDYLFIEKR